MLKRISIGAAVVAIAAGVAWYVLRPTSSNEPAFVGLQIQGMNAEIAGALGRSDTHGVLVRDVALGSPSDLAGFRRGDLIVRFADEPVDSFDTMIRLVGAARANAAIPVRVRRRGEEVALTLKAGAWTDAWRVEKTSAAAVPQIGLTFVGLTPEVRTQFNLPWGHWASRSPKSRPTPPRASISPPARSWCRSISFPSGRPSRCRRNTPMPSVAVGPTFCCWCKA